MSRSETHPTQFWDALPSNNKDPEEKGTGRMGRIELGPRGEKTRCSNAYRLRGGGRGDSTAGMKEEEISHVLVASRASYDDR
jgi:hypothetical protein